MLEVRLIGVPQLSLPQSPLAKLWTPAFQALLGAILLAPSRSLSRVALAHAFWPTNSQENALGNLRQLLHRLKQTWPECDLYLDFTRQSISWRSLPDSWVDVYALERLQQEPIGQHTLESVLKLLVGPLLEGIDQAWVEPLRAAFSLRQAQYFHEALSWCRNEAHTGLELSCLQRLVEHSPTDLEVFHALAMLSVRTQGFTGLQSVWTPWKQRWEALTSAPPPARITSLIETLEMQMKSGHPLARLSSASGESDAVSSPRTRAPEPVHAESGGSDSSDAPPASEESSLGPRATLLPAVSHPAVSHPAGSHPAVSHPAGSAAPSREAILAQAIVLGDSFPWRLLADCMHDEAAVLEALELLTHEGILQEARAGTFSFVDPLDRQARYARMSGAKRQALHSRVITHLLAQPDRTPALFQTLNEHLQRCGEGPEVGRQLVLALRAFTLQEAPQQLYALSAQALLLLDPDCAPDLRWSAHFYRANAAILLRDASQLDQDYAALRALSSEMPDLLQARTQLAVLRLSIANLKSDVNEILAASAERAALADAHGLKEDACEANLQLAIILSGIQRYAEAERVLERARGYAEQLSNPEPMIHILLLEGAQLMRKLELEAAREALTSISERMNEVQDEGLRTRYLLHHGATLMALGEHRVAAQELTSLHTRLENRKLTYYADMVPFFLIRAKLEGGYFAEAARLLEQEEQKEGRPLDALYRRVTNRLDLCMRLNDLYEAEQVVIHQPHPPQQSALGLTFNGLHIALLLAQSRWEDALRLINVGLELARGLESLQIEAALKLRLAKVLLGMKDMAGAEWILRELSSRAPQYKAPWPPWRLELQGTLAEAILAQQRPQDAWEVLNEVMPTLKGQPDRYAREHVLWALRAELARQLGHPEEVVSTQLALQALQRLEARMTPAQRARWMRAPEQVAVSRLKQWRPHPAQYRD